MEDGRWKTEDGRWKMEVGSPNVRSIYHSTTAQQQHSTTATQQNSITLNNN
jgi:hypothetical protein